MVRRGISYREDREEGRFYGPRVNCEQVPLLPARAVAWAPELFTILLAKKRKGALKD